MAAISLREGLAKLVFVLSQSAHLQCSEHGKNVIWRLMSEFVDKHSTGK